MKKILFAALISLGFVGNAFAFAIDGETAGTDKHIVVGFGSDNTFQADSNVGATTVVVTGAVAASAPLNTDGLADAFIHDYLFGAMEDTWFAINSISETSSGTPGTFIDPIVLQIWEFVNGGADILLASDSMDQVGTNVREAAVFVMFEAGKDYIVRVSNEGGNIGSTADYSLEMISAIPVPAAVWLFGTALVGLMGFRRKNSAAAA